MKNTSNLRVIVNALAIASLLATPLPARSADDARKQILPSAHPLSKIVVQVNQVGADPLMFGNGFVVGSEGCHLLTNFHVAFGKGRDAKGEIAYVQPIQPGHELEVSVGLNSKTGTFQRKLKARVVEFAAYRPNDRRGLRNDMAMLKLDECLGKDYALARCEVPDDNVKVPETELSTLSLTKVDSSRSALYLEEKCVSASTSQTAGLFFHTCQSLPSMSGSPIFRKDSDGGFTIVGITTGRMPLVNGNEAPYAIYSSIMTPFVQGILGSGTKQREIKSALSTEATP